jgi:hypothetical protein
MLVHIAFFKLPILAHQKRKLDEYYAHNFHPRSKEKKTHRNLRTATSMFALALQKFCEKKLVKIG